MRCGPAASNRDAAAAPPALERVRRLFTGPRERNTPFEDGERHRRAHEHAVADHRCDRLHRREEASHQSRRPAGGRRRRPASNHLGARRGWVKALSGALSRTARGRRQRATVNDSAPSGAPRGATRRGPRPATAVANSLTEGRRRSPRPAPSARQTSRVAPVLGSTSPTTLDITGELRERAGRWCNSTTRPHPRDQRLERAPRLAG